MTDKVQKNQIADILMDFYDEYDSNVINRPMIPNIYAGKILDSLQEEPVSEELKEAADNALENITDQYDILDVGGCLEMFKLGAQWQKEQDQETIETAIHHAYHNGRLEMKEQMMAKAIDATLLNGNLIKQKRTTHPLHVGDKVKVIVIKED